MSRIRGYLDNLTHSGYFEGWAVDVEAPLTALHVSVVLDGTEIASGLAHRFRRDLMESDCGTGWCAFRLKVSAVSVDLHSATLVLIEQATGAHLHVNSSISSAIDQEPIPDDIEKVCSDDPTIIQGTWQLRGCERIMMSHIRKHGVEDFVRRAYVYVLNRPADIVGLTQYSRSIRQSLLTPVGILEALADSEEFRNQTRQLIAPNASGFPFA